jgi:hypothetical protein
MRATITGFVALLIVLFHIWASHRSPKYWYMGGIIPLVWFAMLALLFSAGQVNIGEDWFIIIFPSLLLPLLWLKGYLAAKKREANKMKAKDI